MKFKPSTLKRAINVAAKLADKKDIKTFVSTFREHMHNMVRNGDVNKEKILSRKTNERL